jgi:ribosomal protein S13
VALINERYKVGDELKRSIRDDIMRLIEAKTYRWDDDAAAAA